jgi:SHS2 domain-containing protein
LAGDHVRGHHRFEEHTGEVRLELGAPSLEELFVEAGRALAELMIGDLAAGPASGPEQRVLVRAADLAALLVEWLNELIFLSETSKQVFTRFRVEHVGVGELEAVVAGVATEALKTQVKAATLHGLSLENRNGTWRASVVLDV